MHFDSVDIRLFVNVAETESLTHGAKKSWMSVPAASMRIKTIEEKLGTQLFHRTSQGVRLAAAGQAFLRHGRLVLRQLEALEGDLREYANGAKGHVRIFASTSAVTEFLPSDLRRFLAKHSDVNVDLREHLSFDIVHAVMEGSADIGILAGDVATEGLQVLPYHHDRNVIVTAAQHPLARRKRVAFRETLQYDYISLVEGPSHTFISQAAHALHKTLKLRIQMGNYEALCRMVETNVGIGLLQNSAAQRYAKTMDIRIVGLTDSWAVRNIRICVRDMQSLPPLTKELVDFLASSPCEHSSPR